MEDAGLFCLPSYLLPRHDRPRANENCSSAVYNIVNHARLMMLRLLSSPQRSFWRVWLFWRMEQYQDTNISWWHTYHVYKAIGPSSRIPVAFLCCDIQNRSHSMFCSETGITLV